MQKQSPGQSASGAQPSEVDSLLNKPHEKPQWMGEFGRWYRQTHQFDAPEVMAKSYLTFNTHMGYKFDIKQARNLVETLKAVARRSGSEDFTVTISSPGASREVSPQSHADDVIAPAKGANRTPFVPGVSLDIEVRGAQSDDFKRRVAWAVATMLADKKMLECELPGKKTPTWEKLVAIAPSK